MFEYAKDARHRDAIRAAHEARSDMMRSFLRALFR
jgi:hypothetical protein